MKPWWREGVTAPLREIPHLRLASHAELLSLRLLVLSMQKETEQDQARRETGAGDSLGKTGSAEMPDAMIRACRATGTVGPEEADRQ